MCRQIRLKLLEQDKDEGNFVLLGQLLQGRLLYLLHIQMQVFVWLKDVGRSVEDVVKELCKEQSSTLVLLLGLTELALQALMLLQQRVVLLPLDDHVTLLLLQLLLQKVDQVIVTFVKIVSECASASRVCRPMG